MSQQTLKQYWDEKVASKLQQQTSWFDLVKNAMDEEKRELQMRLETETEANYLKQWCESHGLESVIAPPHNGKYVVTISW